MIFEDQDRAAGDGLIDGARRAEAAADARLDFVVRQLGQGDAAGLSDYDAATISHLVAGLIDGLVKAFGTALVAGSPPLALPPLRVPLADRAAELIGAALTRSIEHRLTHALQAIRDDRERSIEPTADADTAALELALLVAESARTDRLGEPVLAPADLAAEAMHRLVWRIAAAARGALVADHGPALTDRAIPAAAARILADHDEDAGVAVAAMRLARQRNGAADDGDALVEDALVKARLPLFAALVAVRAAIGFEPARAALSDPERLAVLLRAADVDRDVAIRILLRLADASGIGDGRLVAIVDGFDAISADAAETSVRLLRLDPAYRDAIAEHGG